MRALFIIYRTSSIGMYLKFERNRTTTFGPIAFQRYYDTNECVVTTVTNLGVIWLDSHNFLL